MKNPGMSAAVALVGIGLITRPGLHPVDTFAAIVGALSGLLAACVQHEIDHLNGVLFIDHISRLKRDMIIRRVMKEMRQSGGKKSR